MNKTPWNLRANVNEETQTFASVICSNVIYTVDEKGEESFHGKPWAKWTMNYLSRLHDSHHSALEPLEGAFFFLRGTTYTESYLLGDIMSKNEVLVSTADSRAWGIRYQRLS